MVRALVVYFVTELLHWHAVLAFLIWLMLAFTLLFHFWQEMLETLMLYIRQTINSLQTIRTFFIRSMSTLILNIFNLFFSYTKAINAFTIRPMTTMWSLDFFISEWFCFMLWWTAWVVIVMSSSINHRHIIIACLMVLYFLCQLWLSATYWCCTELSVFICNIYHVTIPIYPLIKLRVLL